MWFLYAWPRCILPCRGLFIVTTRRTTRSGHGSWMSCRGGEWRPNLSPRSLTIHQIPQLVETTRKHKLSVPLNELFSFAFAAKIHPGAYFRRTIRSPSTNISKPSSSRMSSVRRSSMGITIRPSRSSLRTIQVAFTRYYSPSFTVYTNPSFPTLYTNSFAL